MALPDQLFYNTGIFTYVWLVTNRKAPERRGKVQLIDGTRFFEKMKKSLNNKRNEITEGQIRPPDPRIRKLPGRRDSGGPDQRRSRDPRHLPHFREPGVWLSQGNGRTPLAHELRGDAGAIAKLDDQTAFANLEKSKKRKDAAAAAREIKEGRKRQDAIRAVLATLEVNGRYMDRAAFEADVMKAAKHAGLKILAPIKKAIFAALGGTRPRCRDLPRQPGTLRARQ